VGCLVDDGRMLVQHGLDYNGSGAEGLDHVSCFFLDFAKGALEKRLASLYLSPSAAGRLLVPN